MTSIYLDNAATSFPKPESVHRAYDRTIREIGASPGRGGYGASIQGARLLYGVRETVATFFGVSDPSRVIFTHGATESINTVLYGMLRGGDRVVTTSMEHNAVVRPLTHLTSQGVSVTWVNANRNGVVSLDEFHLAVSRGARLAVVNGASNVTGTIQPIATMAEICRRYGVPFLVDASQMAGTIPIHMERDGIDMLAAPAHKGLLGHPGTGILILSGDRLPDPLVRGGTGSRSSDPDQPSELPDRFESGTPNLPGIASLGAGIDFIRETGIDTIRRHELSLCRQLREGIASIDGVRVHGPPDPESAGSVVSFTHDRHDPSLIGARLDQEYGIAVRTGLHCAPLAHRTVGTWPEGTVRVSPGFFNTADDIDRFVTALSQIVREGGQI